MSLIEYHKIDVCKLTRQFSQIHSLIIMIASSLAYVMVTTVELLIRSISVTGQVLIFLAFLEHFPMGIGISLRNLIFFDYFS